LLNAAGFSEDELDKMLKKFMSDETPDGSTQEINPDEFDMQATCPRCQFEFDPK
jgi:hypothetical protein